MSEVVELLPLGSAVRRADDDQIFIIIGRGMQQRGDQYLVGYKAVPYPQGAATGIREQVLPQAGIVSVLHRGFADDRDERHARELMVNAVAAMPAPITPLEEPDLTVDLSADLPADSTDAAPDATVVVEVSDSTDPFRELREKGKRAS